MSFFSGDSDFWQQAWSLVGWTMLWFLASGTVVLIVSGVLRALLKRANSRLRYVTSLAGFAVLAMLPILIAGYLTTSLPRDIARSSGPGLNEPANIVELNPDFETNNQIDSPTSLPRKLGERVADDRSEITETGIPGWDNRAILNSMVVYLPWLWLVGTPLTFLLLATGLIGAERLRKSCQAISDGPIRTACERLRAQLGIARQVGIAICHSVSSPLLIGVVKPLILLPPAALTGWTTEELEMVLLHELAHVRRWDNGVNLVQRIVESLLFFHPATWIMSNWVRRDREDCCDAIVVGQTAKPQAYAELLLTLASHTPGLATSVAMAQHPVASRIRRILKIEDEPMLISRKGLMFGVTIVLATVLLAFALPASEAEEASLPRERGERVGDERSAEETTNLTNNTNKDLTTEDTASTEGVQKESADSVQYSVVYSLSDNEAEIKEWLKAIDELADTVNVISKDGKDMVVVTGTRKGHEKLAALFESKRSATRNAPFPTLEEQRAADFAYKLLGVELEKLSEEDLARVKAKGYSGGLKVVGPLVFGAEDRVTPVRAGDLLVGLHVWPTESLEDTTEILSRFDLPELSPLKFYAIRRNANDTRMGRGGFGYQGEDQVEETDSLTTGRIQVDLDAWAEKEGFKQQRLKQSQPQTDPGPSWSQRHSVRQLIESIEKYKVLHDTLKKEIDTAETQLADASADDRRSIENKLAELRLRLKRNTILLAHAQTEVQTASSALFTHATSPLLYDGKTFDEWRNLWTTELKTEKRIECIKALAAFGRAGRGKQASEAILDVAEQYDFGKGESMSATDLKSAISNVLTGSEGIDGEYWLPLLIERLKSNPQKWGSFSEWVLSDAYGENVEPFLKEIAANKDLSDTVHGNALAALAVQMNIGEDQEAVAMIRTALSPTTLEQYTTLSLPILLKLQFSQLDLFPQQLDLFFHNEEEIRQHALNYLYGAPNSVAIGPVVDYLLAILKDTAREDDHTYALHALAYTQNYLNANRGRKHRNTVMAKLGKQLVNGDDTLLPIALKTMSSIAAESMYEIIHTLSDKVTDERREQLKDLAKEIEAKQQQEGGDGGMGMGGGMGGGGMF